MPQATTEVILCKHNRQAVHLRRSIAHLLRDSNGELCPFGDEDTSVSLCVISQAAGSASILSVIAIYAIVAV